MSEIVSVSAMYDAAIRNQKDMGAKSQKKKAEVFKKKHPEGRKKFAAAKKKK